MISRGVPAGVGQGHDRLRDQRAMPDLPATATDHSTDSSTSAPRSSPNATNANRWTTLTDPEDNGFCVASH